MKHLETLKNILEKERDTIEVMILFFLVIFFTTLKIQDYEIKFKTKTKQMPTTKIDSRPAQLAFLTKYSNQ